MNRADWVRVTIGAVAAVALAVIGGIAGHSMAPEVPARGPYTTDARLAVMAPGEVEARLAKAVELGWGSARLGVTHDFARDSALSMLEVASAELDPQSALPPPTVTPGPPDLCVVAGGNRPGGCPQGLNATILPGDQVRLLTARVAGPDECAGTAIVVGTSDTTALTVSWWSADEDTRTMDARTTSFLTCIGIPDLTPATRYEVHVQVGDQFRRFALDSDGAPLRPAASVYAATPDLIAVTIPHRPDDSVRVFPNVLSGDEPHCDEVTIGYDLFVHPLGSVHATISAAELEAARYDPAFTERTTYAFDVGEGKTIFLCAIVTNADGAEEYVAQTIIQTADRVTPVFRILQASVPDIPEWTATATLAAGQECGAWVPGFGQQGDLVFASGERPVLCDPTDELGSQIEGRGVLPYSTARPTSLTVQLGSPHWGVYTASVDLGEGARCTGFCAVPESTYVEIDDGHGGSVMLQALWGQGTSNGALATEVAAVSDSLGVPLPGPQLDVPTARSVVVSGDDETRGVVANVYIRADREADYVARLVPADGEAECERPASRLVVEGRLDELIEDGAPDPSGRTAIGTLRFSGLCHGTVYRAIIELTDDDGRSTIWSDTSLVTSWGASSRISIPPFSLLKTVAMRVPGQISGGSAYMTLYVDGALVLGPTGGCVRERQDAEGFVQTVLSLGETSRFSGWISFQPADTSDRECVPRPMEAAASIPFAFDVAYDSLVPQQPHTFDIHDPGTGAVVASITIAP